jgi:predicted RND superfamily exporter protein
MSIYTPMTTKVTGTAALIVAIFALVGGAIISGAVPTQIAYGQLPDVDDTVDDTLERAGITEKVREEEENTNNLERQQPIDRENEQELGQEVVDRSEHTYGTNTNIEIKSQVDDQDIAQRIVNGKDLGGESNSESAYVKGKYSRSDSSSSDTQKANEEDAHNGEKINQDEEKTVNQDETWMFGDDAADLDPSDLNPTNIAIPIGIPVL